MDDQQIIELFWHRSEDALAAMEQAYGTRALKLAKQMLHSSRDAEECVSDGLHALWEQIPPEKPRHLWAYFSRVVRNICASRLDYLHAVKRDRGCEICLSELDDCFAVRQDAQTMLESRQISHVINAFLDSQEECNRIIFVRRYYYFDSCADIAKRLGLSRGAVNTRLSRLRVQLREQLEKEDIFV